MFFRNFKTLEISSASPALFPNVSIHVYVDDD